MSQKPAEHHIDKESKSILGTKDNGESSPKNKKKAVKDSENQKDVTNGKEVSAQVPSRRSKRTPSRSSTPQIKNGTDKEEPANKVDVINKETENEATKTEGKKNVCEQTNGTEAANDTPEVTQASDEAHTENFILESESFMEPLVLQPDEPCSELEFEESSDKDSERQSPYVSRCTTRRSQYKRIPTPKTPKLSDEAELGPQSSWSPRLKDLSKLSLLKDLNETDKTDNLSTKVHVGSSSNTLDLSECESSFLTALKHKRSNISPSVSSRRSIKLARNEILKKSFINRANLSIPFFTSSESVDRAPNAKRKCRSESPEERKRFRGENTGIMSKITSPLSSLKNRFLGSSTETSTPKLTSYKDETNHLGGDLFDEKTTSLDVQQDKWCMIM